MKLEKIYNNVSGYFCPNFGSQELILISNSHSDSAEKDGLVHLNNEMLNPLMALHKDHVYFSNYDDQCFSFNIKTGQRKKIKDLPSPQYQNENIVFGTFFNNQNSFSSIFDLDQNKVVQTFNKELAGIAMEGYFAGTEYWDFNKLHFGRINSEVLFQKDFSVYNYFLDGEKLNGLIYKIIGFFENSVLIHLAPKRIFALNLDTGEICWSIDDFISDEKVEEYFLFGRKGSSTPMEWHLETSQSKIHLLTRYFYFTIDLKSQISNLEKDFLDMPNNERLNITSTNLVGEKIYFRAEKGLHFNANVIGEFDLNIKKITWTFENPNNSFFTQAPRVGNNTLYALDSSDDLYTFKMN